MAHHISLYFSVHEHSETAVSLKASYPYTTELRALHL